MSKFFLFLWDHRENLVFILLLLLSLTALSLSGEKRFHLARNINRTVLTPFQSVANKVEYLILLKKENDELRKNNFVLALQVYRLEDAKKQNARLQALLNFQQRAGFKFTACRVISGGLGEMADVFIIDKGSRDGLTSNLPVLVPEGLVGKTVEVDWGHTVVQLYTHPEFRVSAMPFRKEDRAIVASDGSGQLIMMNLPLRNSIEPGDTIVSSGMGGIFPKGIPVGVVESIEEEEELGVMMRAPLKPSVDLSKVSEVFVIMDTLLVSPKESLLFEASDSLSGIWSEN